MKNIIYFLCIILTSLSLVACENIKTDKNITELNIENSNFNEDEKIEKPIDLSDIFNSINGCAVLYSPKNNQYLYYNKTICEQEVSPFSTFKIISALLGLDNGVVNNESSTMNYNGTKYPNPKWNKNLTLKEAFQSSCIWYFKQIVDTIGANKMQEALNDLQYGNRDITQWQGSGINTFEDLNGFWLDSSLKISPIEQVQVLSKIFEEKSKFVSSNIEVLKSIMLIDDDGIKKIYGKTGTGNGKAWFVGFSEENDIKEYFAIYLYDDKQLTDISGNTAKEIALKIIKN